MKVLDRRAVRQRARRRHALLTMFIVVLLGFFAVAFVHAELVADQQELDGIRSRIAEADAHNAKVVRAVEEASSPKVISNRAQDELGMVRAHQPVYLAATAPVRDMPTSISFSGRPDAGPAFAVAATAAELGIETGISGTALVNSRPGSNSQNDVAAPASNPTVAAQVSVAATGSVGGTSVSGATVRPQTPPAKQPSVAEVSVQSSPALAGAATGVGTEATQAPQVATVTVQAPRSSIAGTRAVSVGQQQATQADSGTTNRLGGTNAGTGSG